MCTVQNVVMYVCLCIVCSCTCMLKVARHHHVCTVLYLSVCMYVCHLSKSKSNH